MAKNWISSNKFLVIIKFYVICPRNFLLFTNMPLQLFYLSLSFVLLLQRKLVYLFMVWLITFVPFLSYKINAYIFFK